LTAPALVLRRIDRAARWCADRRRSWWSIIKLIPMAGWPVTAAALVNLLIGVLPIGFVLGTSVAMARIPAIRQLPTAASGWGGVPMAAGLAVAALFLQSVLSPFQAAFTELISRRVDGVCARRLMQATLADVPVAKLEEAAVLDQLSDARRGLTEESITPGAAVAGLVTLIARYAQLAAAVVIVGAVLGALDGVLITVVALVARVGNRGSLTRWSVIVARLAAARRKMYYVFDAGSELAAAKETRMLATLPWWRARADRESAAYLDILWRDRRRVFLRPFMLFGVIVLAGAAVLLITLADAADHGRLSVLGLALAVQAILIAMRFGVYFPEADVQTQYGMAAYDSIQAIAQSAALASGPGQGDLGDLGGQSPADAAPVTAIRFEKVIFSYPGNDRQILAGLDLELPAGTSTAIVGLNGSGKTTLVKLLAQLYQPTAGRIVVDGIDLADLDRRSWQQRLAVIQQDYVRYELDAAANIGLGAPRRMHDVEALNRASAWAGATSVIDALPAGLNTVLSSRYQGGVDLSGGQWQRIALARALFAVEAGASVLILDEPTAQLDVRAEVDFFDQFLELTEGLTTLVISHRFSTVRRAQRIVVLQDGRISEQGSHESLLANGGSYAKLFRLQARRFSAS
jgi:ATP-binding cassette, subfamily B, bacterial